jgi:hypothetical protein
MRSLGVCARRTRNCAHARVLCVTVLQRVHASETTKYTVACFTARACVWRACRPPGVLLHRCNPQHGPGRKSRESPGREVTVK